MSAPKYINDGSFSLSVQNGATKWNYPFFDRGDSVSFEAIIPYLQDQATYNRMAVGTTQTIARPSAGSALCYLVQESNTEDVGSGLLSFTRTWAMLPATRLEGGSLSWGMSLETNGFLFGVRPTIQQIVLSVFYQDVRQWPVQWQFEYYTSRPFPILTPRLTQATIDTTDTQTTTYFVAIYTPQTGSNPPIVTQASNFVFRLPDYPFIAAQDSTVDIYKGNLFVRKTAILTLLNAS